MLYCYTTLSHWTSKSSKYIFTSSYNNFESSWWMCLSNARASPTFLKTSTAAWRSDVWPVMRYGRTTCAATSPSRAKPSTASSKTCWCCWSCESNGETRFASAQRKKAPKKLRSDLWALASTCVKSAKHIIYMCNDHSTERFEVLSDQSTQNQT